jgi:two-component system, chemotaxis family, CheB/CheR fusion protein
LSNLLNNAAKYTRPGGKIDLIAEVQGAEVVITVRDNGIGIPPDMLSQIFDMFAQVDTSLERAQGGLGIGLTIAKKIVEMHGGTISAASAGPGQGSEFVLRLPCLVPGPERSPSVEERVGTGGLARRILVTDDNRDAADTLATLLEISGNDVRTTYDGQHALQVAKEYRPEIILLDIGMPGINGYEVARRLRALPETKDALLVAMTGWGQEEDRQRSREAGFDHHLVKPLDPKVLDEVLSHGWRSRLHSNATAEAES